MQKLDRETSLFRDRFFVDFWWILDPILREKVAKTIRGVSHFSCFRYFVFKTDFERFWGRFGIDFASILGPKTSLKRIRKQIKKIIEFWIDFSSLFDRFGLPLGSKLGPKIGYFGSQGGQKEAKKAFQIEFPKKLPKWTQNDPKMGPKTTPGTPIFDDFGCVFLRISVGSCLVFAW